jgi:hypothetical protein
MNKLFLTITLIALVLGTQKLSAQAKITFNLNLKPQLEDSLFIPGRDQVMLTGKTYPLRLTRPVAMVDEEPIDSIYTVEVMFTRSDINTLLEYNFVLQINSRSVKEDMPRKLEIRGTEALDALYFNSFAW